MGVPRPQTSHLRAAPSSAERAQPSVRELADGLATDLERQRLRIAALMEHLDGVDARLDGIAAAERPAHAA